MIAKSGPETAAARIDLGETGDFDLGGLHVSPARREVRMIGEHRELEPKVAQVLVALAAVRPQVVSRDRLIEQCWDGRIVGDDALNRCIVALRHLAQEFEPAPFAIETVARVGYFLVERPGDGTTATPLWKMSRAKLAIVVLLALALTAAAIDYGWSRFGRAEAAPASIAVLPFRNLSSGESYFAEGVGEEIRSQLAREPQFRVAGDVSSSQFGVHPDILTVSRQLNVDYIVEGSVRSQGNRVRVDASLIKASSGVRLWSDSYDGKLDDIFAIQQQVGGGVAGALRLKLVRSPALSGPLVTNGDAYNLVLTARGLIRTRNRHIGRTAADLLREAIRLDPGYAPAWAGLAQAVQMDAATTGFESFAAAIRQAQGYARHAIDLAPDLAEAHRTLGMLLGYGSPEAKAQLLRAAALDPNNAENLIDLGLAYGAAGEFEQELASYRRAHDLDPLWFRTVGTVAMAFAEMGNRAEAEAVTRRNYANDAVQQNMMLGRIAWILGDFSEAARRWSIVARMNSPRWSDTARRTLNDATHAVGLTTGPLVAVPYPLGERRTGRVWMDAPPTPSVWQARNRDGIVVEVYRADNLVAAKLMLNAGRVSELATTFAGPEGLLRLRPHQPLRVDQLGEAPIVALALRQSGRTAEADRLLGEASEMARTVYRRGNVPFWFEADAAAIWALQGNKDEALATLELAIDRGWTHSGSSDLRDIADEPAFRSLHGQPRFESLRARLAAHFARERSETEALGL